MTDAAPPPPPPPVPGDSKDWTWVLQRVCPECGFDVNRLERQSIGATLRSTAASWSSVLTGATDQLRSRPDADVWSPLEYACHVRDVYELYSQRLQLMMENDGPRYPNWDQDATAVESRYDLAEPDQVRHQLVENAERLAQQFDEVGSADWARTGFRSDGAAFTIETFARYLVHDLVHHLHDVGVKFEGP